MIIQIAILKAVTETFTSGKFEEKKLELEKQSGRTFSFSIPKGKLDFGAIRRIVFTKRIWGNPNSRK